jgi:hypothetical protein
MARTHIAGDWLNQFNSDKVVRGKMMFSIQRTSPIYFSITHPPYVYKQTLCDYMPGHPPTPTHCFGRMTEALRRSTLPTTPRS